MLPRTEVRKVRAIERVTHEFDLAGEPMSDVRALLITWRRQHERIEQRAKSYRGKSLGARTLPFCAEKFGRLSTSAVVVHLRLNLQEEATRRE